MATMHRINLSLKPLSSPLINNNAILCIRPVQKRYKHGRDFPRNIPRPAPPSGEPIFSTPSMTLRHSPAPSAPSYKNPPTSFLPENHPHTPSTSLHPIGTHLPPPLNKRRPRQKTYHLTEDDLAQMRILRNHPDPAQRKSRNELARMYGCSQLFVGMAAPLSKAEVKEVFRKREEQRESWGPKKRFFRDTRAKRKAQWTQSEE